MVFLLFLLRKVPILALVILLKSVIFLLILAFVSFLQVHVFLLIRIVATNFLVLNRDTCMRASLSVCGYRVLHVQVVEAQGRARGASLERKC